MGVEVTIHGPLLKGDLVTALVPAQASIGLPRATMERLAQVRAAIEQGSVGDLIDILLYTDALVTIAREKRAVEIAREAASTRIEAARKIGETLAKLADDGQREQIWSVLPTRFDRCQELAEIPPRLFKKVVKALIEAESACSIPNVIRRARIESLTKVESEIFTDYTGEYWIAEKARGKAFTHIHHGGIEEARRRVGMKNSPGSRRLDHAFATARLHAHALGRIGEGLKGEPRRLVGDAELAQAKVAELLDQALKAMAAT